MEVSEKGKKIQIPIRLHNGNLADPQNHVDQKNTKNKSIKFIPIRVNHIQMNNTSVIKSKMTIISQMTIEQNIQLCDINLHADLESKVVTSVSKIDVTKSRKNQEEFNRTIDEIEV